MKQIATIISLFISILVHSQTIQMDFPKFVGYTYEFVIFQGSEGIKVVKNDTIPVNGKFDLKIPKEYAPYTGMCRWLLTNSKTGGGIDMEIPGYDFSVSCHSSQPTNDSIVYKGYDPVNRLNKLNSKQQVIIDKYKTMAKAMELYGNKNKLYPLFETEMKVQQSNFDAFQKDLMTNQGYTGKYLQIINIINGVPTSLTNDYNLASRSIASHITNNMDFSVLYTSGHWPAIIDTWTQIENNVIENDSVFLSDFQKLSNRIPDTVMYKDFMTTVTQFLMRYGHDNLIEELKPYVKKSGKITSYKGVLSVYNSISVGEKAPSLFFKEKANTAWDSKDFAIEGEYTKTLLIFYETDCPHCEELMKQLPSKYESLKQKGIRIIAISSDVDKNEFLKMSQNFPWKDSYCNSDGMDDINFKNYGVSGTPTLFLVDKQGKIVAKMATLEELLKKL